MAPSGFHFRSVSLPSRLHSLKSLKTESWQNSGYLSQTAPVTLETIQSGLLRLAELSTTLGEVYTHSPGTKQAVEDLLEDSIELIDSCRVIKETVVMIRENVQCLQSALRRKGGLDSGIQHDASLYLSLRKKMQKSMSKSMKRLKNLEHKNGSDHADGNSVKLLTGQAIAVFKSVLVFLSGHVTKQGNWSLVSRVMLAPVRENGGDNEVGRVDFAVKALQGRIRDNCVRAFDVQKELQTLDNAMEGLEIGLERSFRLLVQIRVRLLNIITDL